MTIEHDDFFPPGGPCSKVPSLRMGLGFLIEALRSVFRVSKVSQENALLVVFECLRNVSKSFENEPGRMIFFDSTSFWRLPAFLLFFHNSFGALCLSPRHLKRVQEGKDRQFFWFNRWVDDTGLAQQDSTSSP